MSLTAGEHFGAYEILGPLGEGGMGEVYRAHDTELERDVALKVLPGSFASEQSRVARFEQEAKTLASLNHLNIAQVYGLARQNDETAIVMELVEGPTLADRIELGPLPADEALNVAMQIADALEAAHEQHIIHRDLKPANIKLRPDGTVKVLDFGIAKALAPELASGNAAPIMTTPATQVGTILGTAAYMSPEQARGKPVDRRTDIWSFGCVLYEMLTGQLAFGAEDVPLTLARVLSQDTDLESLPAAISPAVRQTLRLCLQKDPKRRVADIRDVRLALTGAFEPEPANGHPTVAGMSTSSPQMVPAVAITAVVVAAIALGLVLWAPWIDAPDSPETRFSVLTPFAMNPGEDLALSPDGRYLAVASRAGSAVDEDRQLWLWPLDSLDAEPLPGTQGVERMFWSPDSRFIGFSADGALKRVDVRGGPPQTILTSGTQSGGGIWTADDQIVFSDIANGFSRIPAAGGEPVAVTRIEPGVVHDESPALLPDGRHFLYFKHAEPPAIYLADIELTPEEQPSTALLPADDGVKFVPDPAGSDGYILFQRQGTLLAQRFDAVALAPTGEPVPVAAGALGGGGQGLFSVSADGALLMYEPGTTRADTAEIVLVSIDGTETPVAAPPRSYGTPAAAPDGTRIALSADGDIWVWDQDFGTLTRLTFEAGAEFSPRWSRDGRRIIYGDIDSIKARASDGTDAPQIIVNERAVPGSVTEDGWLVYTNLEDNIGVAALDGSSEPRILIGTKFREARPSVSPDGRWIAYQSDESGYYEVYVRPFPDVMSGRWQVSADGGQDPKWALDGRALYYRLGGPGDLVSVPIAAGDRFVTGRAERLFRLDNYVMSGNLAFSRYDVAPDGRFVFVKPVVLEGGEPERRRGDLVVVRNWLEGVKRREARD